MNKEIKTFFSNGKLLLTAEYLVLKGAKALALPINLGQKMELSESSDQTINWVTFEKNKPFFTAVFSLPQLTIAETTNTEKALYIAQVFKAARTINPDFLNNKIGYDIKSTIQFSMNWGLGSSSTLINNIAQWACVDAFELNRKVSKGSGYDIACAQNKSPIVYQLINGSPSIEHVDFKPFYIYELNLVYLNKKKHTESSVLDFLNQETVENSIIQDMNNITAKILNSQSLEVFMSLITEHELIISRATGLPTVKEQYFSDFNGEIKSLGAWGGDFALVASPLADIEQQAYFTKKGFSTFFPLINLITFKS